MITEFFFREASACVYQEEFCGGRGIGEQGVYACVVVAGTGWRWWLFHLFAHDNRLSNQAVRGFSGQRLIVTVKKCLASRSAPPSSSQSSLNSHKYVDSPASRPIVSRGKRARKSGRDNTNFLGQSTVTKVWAWGWSNTEINAIYEEARTSLKENTRIVLHAHLWQGWKKKKNQAHTSHCVSLQILFRFQRKLLTHLNCNVILIE